MHGFLGYRGCCSRRVHGGHLGAFGAQFGDGAGLGGRGFFVGRKLGSSELQLVILALTEVRPRHGYEIIKALEEVSKGFYTPSPGMVYPALTYLEELGYATVETEGTKKLYQITEAGQAKLEENRAVVDAILAQLARVGSKIERVRQMFTQERNPRTSATTRSTRRATGCAPRSSPSSPRRLPPRNCSAWRTYRGGPPTSFDARRNEDARCRLTRRTIVRPRRLFRAGAWRTRGSYAGRGTESRYSQCLVDFRGVIDHALLHDQTNVANLRDVLGRIAVDQDQISKLAYLHCPERSDSCVYFAPLRVAICRACAGPIPALTNSSSSRCRVKPAI